MQDLNSVEFLFCPKDPPLHCISQFYKALISLQQSAYPDYLTKRKTEFDATFTDKQKDKILQLSHTSSISFKVAELETNHKRLTRWHYTPIKLHFMFLSHSPLCWRNCGSRATHAHIWWTCPVIHSFWQDVLQHIRFITGTTLPFTPWAVFFYCNVEPVGPYKRPIIPHLFNAAKALIPTLWGQPKIPTLSQWIRNVDLLYLLEELTFISKGKIKHITGVCLFR